MIDIIRFAKRHGGVGSINTGTASIGEMAYLEMAAIFENILEPQNIAINVSLRIVDRMAHAGLGREVDNEIRTTLGEYFPQIGLIGNISVVKLKPVTFGQMTGSRLF